MMLLRFKVKWMQYKNSKTPEKSGVSKVKSFT